MRDVWRGQAASESNSPAGTTPPSPLKGRALAVRIPVGLLGTASLLPGRAVTTDELARSMDPPRSTAEMERKTGIKVRHWTEPGTEMAPIAAEVLRKALDDAGMEAKELARIIFVSSNGGDKLVPATANRVAALLGLAGTCDAFDLNNACMGFLTGFDIAARSVATGLGPVAVVVVEMLSRGIRKEDPRPWLVGGDAAAAAIFGGAKSGEGILEIALKNDGTLAEDVVCYQSALTGKLEYLQFKQSSGEMVKTALDALVDGTNTVLGRAGLALSDVDWVLPHQPNGRMLRLIVDALGIDEARMVTVVPEIGSVAAAAIPVSLDRLLRTRPVRRGDRILMVGVGAGVSHGALLFQVGRDARVSPG